MLNVLTALLYVILATLSLAVWLPLIPAVTAQQTTSYSIYVEPLPDWAADYAGNVMYSATKAWEDANPDIKFYQASSPEEADLIVQWIRDYGTEYVGEAIGGQVIQVGLGNSYCMGQWNPFSSETVTLIAEHELGHFLGFDHSSDESDIMYPTLKYRYGAVEVEENLAPNYAWFVSVCTLEEVTSYWYQVEMEEEAYGFDVYFVPSKAEYDQYTAGSAFSYYSDADCYGENYVTYSRTCGGVAQESGLLIIAPDKLTNSLTRIKVQLMEMASDSAKVEIPTVEKQQPQTTDPPSDASFVSSPITDYKHVQGTDFSVYTSIVGGSIYSIAVNPSDTSLAVSLSADQQNGSLLIVAPRNLIDSRENEVDVEFAIFANGNIVDSEEISKDSKYRTLMIYFPRGTSTIDIIGTNVVPEFGSLVAILFGIGIVSSIIAISFAKKITNPCCHQPL